MIQTGFLTVIIVKVIIFEIIIIIVIIIKIIIVLIVIFGVNFNLLNVYLPVLQSLKSACAIRKKTVAIK